jgi:hypothetical protein
MPDEAGNETMAERVARVKGGDTSSPNTAGNTSTTGDTAFRDASDPQRAASRTSNEGGAVPGADGSGGTKTLDSDKAASQLGEETAQVTSGAKQGEKVRETPAGRLAESNDVILGDQSSRADGPKPGKPEDEYVSDGSRSPHDSTSDGGSRQQAGHSQALAAKGAVKEAADEPAFRAEAKARTI